MAEYKEHCRDCLMALGEEYGHVHKYLDKFFWKKGPKHRLMRHHREGVEEVRTKWGNGAARAAEIHIEKDWEGIRVAQINNGDPVKVPTKQEAIVLVSYLL